MLRNVFKIISDLFVSHLDYTLFQTGTCKARNEIETKRNETERNEIKRKETKPIETKRNEIKRNETKRIFSKTKCNGKKMKNSIWHED